MQIGAFLCFKISGDCLFLEKITEILKITPRKTYRAGDVCKNKYLEFAYQEDCWLASYEVPEEQSFEDAVTEFLQPYLLQKELIVDLAKKHSISLFISLYPEENQMNICLSKKILEILYELNVELNMTTLYLSDFYEGKA